MFPTAKVEGGKPSTGSFVSLPSACPLLSCRFVKSQGGTNMAKQLSERLADLSAHAKKAEDTVAAAQKETHDKVMSRWEQARADATATTEIVNDQIESVGDRAAKDWNARRRKSPPTWML